MSAQAIGALLRASWFQARSYRMSLVTQVFGLIITVIPMYLVATALHPTMAQAIEGEAEQFFGIMPKRAADPAADGAADALPAAA